MGEQSLSSSASFAVTRLLPSPRKQAQVTRKGECGANLQQQARIKTGLSGGTWPAPTDSYRGLSRHLFCCSFRSFRHERSSEELKAAAENEPKGDGAEEGLWNPGGGCRAAPHERGPAGTPRGRGMGLSPCLPRRGFTGVHASTPGLGGKERVRHITPIKNARHKPQPPCW